MLSDKDKNLNPISTPNSTQLTSATLFSELLEADKNRLFGYIYAFVSNHAIADDVFQETCLTLWKEFERFEPGTSFSKWANTIAFNRVLSYRKKHKRDQVGFSDEFFEDFSESVEVIERNANSQEQKWHYLAQCKSLLSAPLQNVYQRFYVYNETAQQIADDSERSIHAIRKSVHKLRKSLIDCIDKKMKGAS